MISLAKRLRPLLVFFIVPIVIPLAIFLTFKYSSSFYDPKIVISGDTMGTTYSISIYSDNQTTRKDINNLKNKIDSILVDINSKMSTYDSQSELSQFNNSEKKSIQVSTELSEVVSRGIKYSEHSSGLYDITILPLVELWGFADLKISKKPDSTIIKNLISSIGFDKIKINNQNILIRDNLNIKIDLSSIAKGYAVDIISLYLSELGYANHLVEIGGEVRTKGTKNGNNWKVEIASPTANTGYKLIELADMSIATSGTYNNNRKFDGDDKAYSHILNIKTGYPITHNTLSATIISPNCIDADALATASMTMDTLEAIELITKLGYEGLILVVNQDGSLTEFKTPNLDKYLRK